MPSLGEVLALLAHGLPGFEEGQQMVLDRRRASLEEQRIKAALDQMAFEQQMSEKEYQLLLAQDLRERDKAVLDAQQIAFDRMLKENQEKRTATTFGQQQQQYGQLQGPPPPGTTENLGLDELGNLSYQNVLELSPLRNDYIRALAALDSGAPGGAGGADPNKPPIDTPEEVRGYVEESFGRPLAAQEARAGAKAAFGAMNQPGFIPGMGQTAESLADPQWAREVGTIEVLNELQPWLQNLPPELRASAIQEIDARLTGVTLPGVPLTSKEGNLLATPPELSPWYSFTPEGMLQFQEPNLAPRDSLDTDLLQEWGVPESLLANPPAPQPVQREPEAEAPSPNKALEKLRRIRSK